MTTTGGDALFCSGGGCTAKLGPRVLSRVLGALPRPTDPDLLVGYEASDDAAVLRVSDDLALVSTLDFFPPAVADPYVFGQIAAANAMSDVWAMGGTVRTALNIVAFPEQGDLNLLGRILAGGAERVAAAGASLAGGHSIGDDSTLYGLSVTGTVHPDRIWRNNTPRPGDALVLTKPLGTGIALAAHRMDAAPAGLYERTIATMIALNLDAATILADLDVHAATDVTGFGFLGHLLEMLGDDQGADVDSLSVPTLPGVTRLADEFYITAAAQRNRTHAEASGIDATGVPFGVQEVLCDPQTSGGLLVALPRPDAEALIGRLDVVPGHPRAGIVGTITGGATRRVTVR